MPLNVSALRQNLAAKQGKNPQSSNSVALANGAPSKSARNSDTLPNSADAENGVLAVMLQYPDRIPEVCRSVTQWHFHAPTRRTVFEAVSDLNDSGGTVGLIELTQSLIDKGKLEEVGGAAFITDLQTINIGGGVGLEGYIKILRQKLTLRELIRTGQNMARAAHGLIDGDEVEELAGKFSTQIERIKHNAGGPNGVHELTTQHLRDLKLTPDKNALVGNRWLVRGGSSLWAAGAGYGKSSLTMQLAVYWACGQSVFGLRPHFPIKSLIIQAENDDHDMSEQYNGVIEGIAATGDLDIEAEQETIDKNLIMLRAEGVSGLAFLNKLNDLLEIYRPAMLWIDPLFSFAGCDLIDAEKTGRFLREGLFPLFTKFLCCGNVIHHVGKPPRAQQSAAVSTIDEQYLSFGSSEIQNAFRSVNVIKPPTQDAPGVFRLVLSKRGERAKAKDTDGNLTCSIYLKHSFPHICWQQVAEPDEKKKGNAAKYTTENLIEVLSVAHGWKATDLQKHLKDESGMASSTFYTLWNEVKKSGKVRCDDDGKWYKKGLTKA